MSVTLCVECRHKLEDVLGLADSKLCDFTSTASMIMHIFKASTSPSIAKSVRGKVDVPEYFTVRIGGSNRVYALLGDPTILLQFPIIWIKSFLDVISIILSRGVVNVIRFHCAEENEESAGAKSSQSSGNARSSSSAPPSGVNRRKTLVRILLDLLEFCQVKWQNEKKTEGLTVLKRVVHLIGLAATAGLTTVDAKDLLSLLQAPSVLTLPLLQALKKMLGNDSVVVKANPMSFFNLGGRGSGITSAFMQFPFTENEYQFFTWFRVEEFENSKLAWPAVNSGSSNANQSKSDITRTDETQHIISIVNDLSKGIDVYIHDAILHVVLAFPGAEPVHIVIGSVALRRGVWYHFSLRHQKAARLSMFSKDEMVIRVDHQIVYQDIVKYPDALDPNMNGMQYKIGQNFDGQITAVYFLRETLHESDIETKARIDAGKPLSGAYSDGGVPGGASATFEDAYAKGASTHDNAAGVIVPRRKGVLDLIGASSHSADVFSQESTFKKILAAYYPDRCMYNHALDIHGGMHGKLGKNTHAWNMAAARDVFGSIGGVSCILPMLPRLLIDNYNPNRAFSANLNSISPVSPPIKKSNTTIMEWTDNEKDMYDIFETEPMNNLMADLHESKGDSCISLILQILSKVLNNHKLYQRELKQICGIEMIEYALTAAPTDTISGEGESVVSALKLLRSSVVSNSHLDNLVIKHLLLNLKMWSRSTYEMQRGLVRVILAYANAEPMRFGGLVDVQLMLEQMMTFYSIEHENIVKIPESEADADDADRDMRSGIAVDSDVETLSAQGDEDGEDGDTLSQIDSKENEGQSSIDDPNRDTLASSLVLTNIDPLEAAGDRSNFAKGNLDIKQKQLMRQCIQNVILSVIQSHPNPQQHVQSLVDFMTTYKNATILNEIANMLLVVIVEGGKKIMSCLVESCHGAEEFISFVIRTLIHQPNEELRCTGIRIITHFYLRADLISNRMSKMSLKKKKTGNIVTRAMEQLKETLETDLQGLARLQACGGIALLSEIITSHKDSSTVLTYKVLLEMLLSKPHQASRVDVLRTPLLDEQAKSLAQIDGDGRVLAEDSIIVPRVGEFAVQFMTPDQLKDDLESDINPFALPLFLELLPKLNLGDARQEVYSDLLSLLKHSEGNRAILCSCLSWHTCLHDLMAQLVVLNIDHSLMIDPEQLGVEIDLWAERENFVNSGDESFKENAILQSPLNINKSLRLQAGQRPPNGSEMRARTEKELHSEVMTDEREASVIVARIPNGDSHLSLSSQSSHSSWRKAPIKSPNKAMLRRDPNSSASPTNLDIWFAIGMKVYSTLLVHAVESKGGWREVSRTTSQSIDTEFSFHVTQSVLSHVVSELTFVMQWKYKDLRAMATSKIEADNIEALSYMNNAFSVFVTVGQYALHDTSCMTCAIEDWNIAKLRLLYMKEIVAEIKAERAKNKASGYNSHIDMEYLQELTEARLVERIAQSRMKKGSSANASGSSGLAAGHAMGLDSQVVEMSENNPALSHPYLREVHDFMSFRNHKWVDMGLYTEEADRSKEAANSVQSSRSFNGDVRFGMSHLLHPLERGATVNAGRLILVLQNLRFFDSFFWPNDAHMLRNGPMLRFSKEKEHEDEGSADRGGSSISLCFSVVSQCLFVLNTLCPLHDLAAKTVNRLHVIIESISNVTVDVIPVNELILTIIAHITFSLQRLNASLGPVFTILGLDAHIKLSNMGLVRSDEEVAEDERVAKEETIFNNIYVDLPLVNSLETYFNTSAGQHLFSFLLSCFFLLVTAFDMKRPEISEHGMDERTFSLLESLVERIKFDVDYFHSCTEKVAKKDARSGRDSRNQSARSKKKPVDTYGDVFQMRGADEDSDDDFPAFKKPHRSSGHALREKISFLKETCADWGTIPVGTLRGPLIVKVLQWMRDSYFTCNLNKNVGMATVVASMERAEAGYNKGYLSSMDTFNAALTAERDFGSKSIAEMSNLNNLSGHVSKLLARRWHGKRLFQVSVETHKLKSVAKHWNDSIRKFGADWSPWYQKEMHSHAPYEISRHKDLLNRQMLLVSARNPIDYTDAAYLEGKHRDQMIFEMEQELLKKGDKEAANTLKSTLALENENKVQDSPFSNILKNLQSSVNNNGSLNPNNAAKSQWGDDDDDDDDVHGSEYATFGGKKMRSADRRAGLDQSESLVSEMSTSHESNAGESSLDLATDKEQVNPMLFTQNRIQRPPWTEKFHWASSERPLMLLEASKITVDKNIAGILLLTNEHLYFHPIMLVGGLAMQGKTQNSTVVSMHDRRWSLSDLKEFYGRRYLLQNCAIELFFTEEFDILFALKNAAQLQKLFRTLKHQYLPMVKSALKLNPMDLIQRSPYTEMWKHRQISNFEYLMHLNKLAGRSYNDITQYPVFPWIISDYTSSSLDLSGNTSGVFRDLSKPVGALNPERLREILDRYSSFDADTPVNMRFMYGSHYSSAGVVVFFLLRQEPYTSLAINLQGGRFDCPDRLFFDVAQAWRGCNQSVSDVKELIPEMYFCPEMFVNSSKLPLGHLQDEASTPVDDVVLPPWANGSPYEFVRIMREALESDYVSEHLHEWIDLIFGYKQTGHEAVAANNLFYYLTYEGAIDINAITDPIMREAAKAQVMYYGQTPSQLFKEPHDKRLPSNDCVNALCSDINRIGKIMGFTPQAQFGKVGKRGAVIAGCCSNDRLVVLHADLTLCSYSWSSFPDGAGIPFESRPIKSVGLPCANLSISEDILQRRSLNQSEGKVSRRTSAFQTVSKAFTGWFSGNADKNAQTRDINKANSGVSTPKSGDSANLQDGVMDTVHWNSQMGTQRMLSVMLEVTAPTLTSKDEISTQHVASIEPSNARRNTLKSNAESAAQSKYLSICHRKVSLTIDAGAGRVFSSGYWDNSMKVHEVDSLKNISDSCGGHIGPVMCLHTGDKTGKSLISGGRDGTLRLWIDSAGASTGAHDEDFLGFENADLGELQRHQGMICIRTMCGHTSPITCINHSAELGVIISGSSDGLLCVHSYRHGHFVRAIRMLVGHSVDSVLATTAGFLLAYSKSSRKLCLFWLNGQHVHTITTDTEMETMMVNGAGGVLVCGMENGMVEMRSLYSLELISTYDLRSHGAITCMWCSQDQQFIMVGSSDGTFTVLTDPEERWRLLHAAIARTPMLSTLG